MTDIEPILERLGLLQYYEVFTEEGFDTWETLLDVQENDLEALGVKLGHRRRLQRAIAEYRGYSSDRPLGSPPQDTSGQDNPKLEASYGQTLGNRDQSASAIAEPKRKYRRHPKADEHAPEKPPSAYVIFSNKTREEIKHRNLSFTEMARFVGERWQRLDPAEKEKFENYAASLKEKYNSQLAEYKKTDTYKEYAQYLADFKAKHSTVGETKADSKRLKLEGEHGTGRTSLPTLDDTETMPHMLLHARGGSSGDTVAQSLQPSSGSTPLRGLASLPTTNVADRRRLSPNYQFPHERHLPTVAGLPRSPPAADTPPPTTTTRRHDRPDMGYITTSPTWPRQGSGGYPGSTGQNESPTKSYSSQSFSTSPEEMSRDRHQDLRGPPRHMLSPTLPSRQQQQQPQSPTKGSLPISQLVGPNVSPETSISSAQRILPLPYSPAGSQTQSTSTIFGQASVPVRASPFQTTTERVPLPQRYASATRKRSDDEAANPSSGAPESQSSSRSKKPR